MQKLSIALKKQKRMIAKLKEAQIVAFTGFGRELLAFNFLGLRYPDGSTNTQAKIESGYYESVQDFDSYHTADIEFSTIYHGNKIEKYKETTKKNLIDLGKAWRERSSRDFPQAEVTIVVHKSDGTWFLDTFNYRLELPEGIYV